MTSMKFAKFFGVLFCLVAGSAYGETGYKPALCGKATAGYFTHKSKLAESNDTGLRYDYEAGLYAGNARFLGAYVRGHMETSTFALVSKALATNVVDFVLKMHMGPVYVGPVYGMSTYKYTESGAVTFDLSERHYGANVGFEYELGRKGLAFVDALVVMSYSGTEATSQTIKVGMRTEADVGFAVPMSRSFGVAFGAKYIMSSLQSKSDVTTMPYVGIKGDFDF